MKCQFCNKPCFEKFCSVQCFGSYQKTKGHKACNPKLCKNCSKPLPYEKRKNSFCNQSCAAQHNNTGRRRSLESRLKTSRSLTGRSIALHEFNWQDIQNYYDQGYSTRECCMKFGFGNYVWSTAKSLGLFRTRPPETFDLEAALVENSSANRARLKKYLIKKGLLENKCAVCSHEPKWNGKPLTYVLDHINGINNDNRLSNLRLLCPNCNSQMETFCRGSKKNLRVSKHQLISALKQSETIKEALVLAGMDTTANSYGRVRRLLSSS